MPQPRFPDSNDPPRSLGDGPLVPLLRAGEDPADPIVRETWREAISVSVLPDIPHELFGFWLFPRSGGAVLLGPAALEADSLAVPLPPSIGGDRLRLLEEVVEAAGYRSTTAVVSAIDSQEVGLLLFAALESGAHGARARAAAQLVADAVAPSLARLASRWQAAGPPRPERTASDERDAIAHAARVAAAASSPRDLASGLSETLMQAIPHERFELLAPGASLDQWYRLGAQSDAGLWGDPDLVVSRAQVDLAGLLGTRDGFLLTGLPGEPVAFPPMAGAPAMRSVIGVRLTAGTRTVGMAMLGHSAHAQYLEEDLQLLRDACHGAAARLDAFVMAGHLTTLRHHVAESRGRPARLARILESLATVPSLRDALGRMRSEAASLLPFDELRIALRLGDESRVAIFEPGEPRALPDLPQVPLGTSPLGRVLRGSERVVVTDQSGTTVLVAALRVQGHTVGALLFEAAQEGMFSGADEETAAQLADAVAPHLELLRRAALGGAMMPVSWKRTPRSC